VGIDKRNSGNVPNFIDRVGKFAKRTRRNRAYPIVEQDAISRLY